MKTSSDFLDRLIERLDQLDQTSVQSYVLRLVRERGFLETVFNTIREGVVVIDRQLSVHYCNPAAQSMLGFPDEYVGQKINRYLRDVNWARLISGDPHEWGRVSMQEIEVFYPERRLLSFYLVPYFDERQDTRIPLATLILHDVTALHEDRERTVESEKLQALTMLAAGVAHEVGNPLNSLNIHLQLLRRRIRKAEEDCLPKDAGELLDVALQEVVRLDSIVSNFLRAIRPENPDLKPTRVQAVIEEGLRFMRQEIEDRGILVQAQWPDDLPRVPADADQLKQALYNLFKNAIQAMPDGGVLSIVCDERGGSLEVRVGDTGQGIGAERIGRIMDPYYSTKKEGSGLGLMIVDRIVRGHGGELLIETEDGRGSIFTVRLPLRRRRVRLLEAPPVNLEPADSIPE